MNLIANSGNRRAWVDLAACAGFALLFALSVRESRLAAEEAVRLYGRNVDSGAYIYLLGLYHFVPAAILFLIAAVALFQRWRLSRFLHGLAWGWVVLPILAFVVLGVSSLVAA
jgi:hypothetical protein